MKLVNKKIIAEDSIIISESISMSVFRTGSLLPCARNLSKMVQKADQNIDCLAMATIMMCAAAIDASLFEYANKNNKNIYEKKDFSRKGIALKYFDLFGNKLEDDYKDVDELVKIRNAIVHNEPEHDRELTLGSHLTKDKSLWAFKTTENFIKNILGNTFN